MALKYAQHLAETEIFEHSKRIGSIGENLSLRGYGHVADGKSPVDAWYDEIQYYNFSHPNFGPLTGKVNNSYKLIRGVRNSKNLRTHSYKSF